MNTKTCHLEVNDSGGWRRVISFDAADDDDSETVLHLADQLLRWSMNAKLKARVIMPGDTAPLMNWTAELGWREWGRPSNVRANRPARGPQETR